MELQNQATCTEKKRKRRVIAIYMQTPTQIQFLTVYVLFREEKNSEEIDAGLLTEST